MDALPDTLMWSHLIEIRDVCLQNTPHLHLAEDQEGIFTFALYSPEEPFADDVRAVPGRAIRCILSQDIGATGGSFSVADWSCRIARQPPPELRASVPACPRYRPERGDRMCNLCLDLASYGDPAPCRDGGEAGAKLSVIIANEIGWSVAIGRCFTQLLGYPGVGLGSVSHRCGSRVGMPNS